MDLIDKTFSYKGKEYTIVRETAEDFVGQNSEGNQVYWPKEVIVVGKALASKFVEYDTEVVMDFKDAEIGDTINTPDMQMVVMDKIEEVNEEKPEESKRQLVWGVKKIEAIEAEEVVNPDTVAEEVVAPPVEPIEVPEEQPVEPVEESEPKKAFDGEEPPVNP